MARKNEHEKAAARGRKARDGTPHAGREAVAKAKAAAKSAPAPPTPKVKFRGRVLENEPLARYTTYRIGGPARYFVMPAHVDDVVKALELAQSRAPPWLALRLGSDFLVKDTGLPRGGVPPRQGVDPVGMEG